MLELSLMSSMIIILLATACAHPLILCLNLIGLATAVGAISGLVFMKWIFYAVILIFLGGMMVIFIYVTTLAGNEKFFLKPLTWHNFIFFIPILTSLFVLTLNTQFKSEFFMAHTYSLVSIPILWFLVMFLFSALITVVKMAESFKGALIKFS